MWVRTIALSAAFAGYGLPALAAEVFQEHQPKPKPITTLTFAEREVEFLAVTKRARADTWLRRERMEEARDMRNVLPGYPQPAIVSIDMRIKF